MMVSYLQLIIVIIIHDVLFQRWIMFLFDLGIVMVTHLKAKEQKL